MRRLNALRTRPSPCSDEFTPSNSATSSRTSSATAAHRLDPAGLGEVDERADVQAADRAVPVPAGAQPVAVEDLAEARDVVAEPLGRHRGVLDERERPPRALARRHQQPEAGLAHLGQRLLLGRRLGHERVVAWLRTRGGRAARAPPRACPRRRSRTAARPGRPRASRPARRYSSLERDSSRIVRSIISTAAAASASAASGGGDRVGHRLEVPDREHARLRQRHEARPSASVIATSVPSEPVTSRARSNSRARRSSR